MRQFRTVLDDGVLSWAGLYDVVVAECGLEDVAVIEAVQGEGEAARMLGLQLGDDVTRPVLDGVSRAFTFGLQAVLADIAERDERLARLRREMDTLREGLRSAHDPELIAHDVMVAAKAVAP